MALNKTICPEVIECEKNSYLRRLRTPEFHVKNFVLQIDMVLIIILYKS